MPVVVPLALLWVLSCGSSQAVSAYPTDNGRIPDWRPKGNAGPDQLAFPRRGGVVCTLVKNENNYLPEWVEFHLMLGVSKIAVYDDASDQPVAQLLSQWAPQVDVHDVYQLPGSEAVRAESAVHVMVGRQLFVYRHCVKTYVNASHYSWLGIFDVDEYVFPCTRAPVSQPLKFSLGREIARFPENTNRIRLECLRFGPTDRDVEGHMLTRDNTKRAPYEFVDSDVEKWVREKLTGCEGYCEGPGGPKNIYPLDVDSPLYTANDGLRMHAPGNEGDAGWHMEEGTRDRRIGICCNHYQFRTTHEWKTKGERNHNPYAVEQAKRPHVKHFYLAIHDVLVWQYLADLSEQLMWRGFSKYFV